MGIATGDAILAADVNNALNARLQGQLILKTGDETVNNSNVYQNDDELVIPVGANEIWYVLTYLLVRANVTSYIKVAFTVPVAATFVGLPYGAYGPSANATQTAIAPTDLTAYGQFNGVAGDPLHGIISGIYVGGANAGNLQLQWAQLNAEVYDTKVYTNSFILAHKLA